MIPVLQLDPLNLAIWMDPEALGRGSAADGGRDALFAAWAGNDFAAAVAEAAFSEDEGMDIAYLGSCMWHEKRHFFDLCVTSYGAWRLRNMFVIGANAWAVGAHAADRNEPLVFPLTAYCDATQREVMGLAPPPPNVMQISKDIRTRKRSLYAEAAPYAEGHRSLRLDGQAQMEGLALMSQIHCLAKTFGSEGASAVYERNVGRMDRFGLYRWIEGLSLYLGCHRERGDGAVEIDHEFATALLVAGLCGRWCGTPGEDTSVVKPSERMSRLLLHFGQGSGRFGMTTDEASERVDDASLALWGRRLWQELDADLEESVSIGVKLRQEFGGLGEICDAFEDYVDLRRTILDEVKAAGPSGLSPRAFGAHWADRLRPWLLTVNPAGRMHEPEEDLRVHFGLKVQSPSAAGVAWAWREDDPRPDDAVGLKRMTAWAFIIEQVAPLAKLALAGRQHALMLYPELERIIADLEGRGVSVRFAPGFEWPQPRDRAARAKAARSYADLIDVDHFVCDVTGERITVDDAQLLTAWEFRRSPLAKLFQNRAAGGLLSADRKLEVDWSVWIVRADLLA